MPPFSRPPADPKDYPLIPDGPLKALSAAIDACTRRGPITLELLTGKPKAIITSWGGDLKQPRSYDPNRGDGQPTYTEPGCHLWQDLPHWMKPDNYRMAVPVWLIHTPPNAPTLDQGGGTVLCCGFIFPLHNGALVDLYVDGRHKARHYIWDSEIRLHDIMHESLPARLEELAESGAVLQSPGIFTPEWRPSIGTTSLI